VQFHLDPHPKGSAPFISPWADFASGLANALAPVTAQTQIVLLRSDGKPLQYTQSGSSLVITMPASGNQQAATRGQSAFAFRVTS